MEISIHLSFLLWWPSLGITQRSLWTSANFVGSVRLDRTRKVWAGLDRTTHPTVKRTAWYSFRHFLQGKLLGTSSHSLKYKRIKKLLGLDWSFSFGSRMISRLLIFIHSRKYLHIYIYIYRYYISHLYIKVT